MKTLIMVDSWLRIFRFAQMKYIYNEKRGGGVFK